GKLDLSGGGTHTGSFDVAGATLEFGGGTHNLSAASSVSGTAIVVSGGSGTFGGEYGVTGRTLVSRGTAELSGSVTSVGALAISGGTANLSNTQGTLTVPTLMLANTGVLTGSTMLTVTGMTEWMGGTMSGAGITNTSGGLTMSGTSNKTLSRV